MLVLVEARGRGVVVEHRLDDSGVCATTATGIRAGRLEGAVDIEDLAVAVAAQLVAGPVEGLEAAAQLGLRRNEMERAVKLIRQKMADWKPSAAPAPVAA